MHNQGYLLLAIAIPNIILGGFILLRNARDLTNLFFGAFILVAALWSLGLSQFIFTDNYSTATWWAREYYFAASLIPILFLGFCLSFTNKWGRTSPLAKYFSLACLAAIQLLIFRPDLLINNLVYHDWGKEVILNHAGYLLYTLFFVVFVGAGFAVLAKSLAKSKGLFRVYLQFLIAGLAIAFSMGMLFNLFYPALGNYRYIWVGPLCTLVYISAVSYAIIRHRLFDIRSVAVRTFAYILTFFLLSILYIVVVLLASNFLLGIHFSQRTIIGLSLIALFTAAMFHRLHVYFNKVTAKLFFRDYYEPQELIDHISNTLVGSVSIDRIIRSTTKYLRDALKPQQIDFLLEVNQPADTGSEKLLEHLLKTHKDLLDLDDVEISEDSQLHDLLASNNINLALRLRTSNRVLGYIVFGFKESGTPYTDSDKKVLSIIADEIAIALQNAIHFREIQRFNVTLQGKVDEATKKLRHANTKLKELDATKDEFISMASHQLRTPLTTIKGYLSMILEGDVGKVKAAEKEMIQQAFDSAENMVDLIADLLNISRMQSGKFVIENKPTQLADMVAAEVKRLSETASSKKITLSFDKPASLPILLLDENKMRQVIMNFLDNALYYTPAGGSVSVALEATKDSVSYTVTDNGMGVPRAVQHHLFSKFYRADNARKMRPDGTGLGLFMAKKVIVAQGGAIIFKSVEGKGSTFGFSFPRAKLEVKK